MDAHQRRTLVIVGGGFGGIFAARELRRKLDPGSYNIVLISDRNYFVFQPLLPEVAAGTINSEDAVSPLRSLLPGVTTIEAQVLDIDFAAGEVHYIQGRRRRILKHRYHHLVLAGGQQPLSGILPGLDHHSLSMRNLEDARTLRNRVIGSLELAEATRSREVQQEALTFVVAGGGFAGVETMGELVELVDRARDSYPDLPTEQIRFYLIHMQPELLPELPAELGRYARRHLQARGVQCLLETGLAKASFNAVTLNDGSRIATRNLISTIGNGPSELAQTLELPSDRGRICVAPTLEVENQYNVWALGDMAAVPLPDGTQAPPTAQFALREARRLADNIRCREEGRSLTRFQYQPRGVMASLGHYKAVASIGPLRFKGLFAWLLWRGFYIGMLPGLAARVRVMLNWLFDYFLPRNVVHMEERDETSVERRLYDSASVLFNTGERVDGFYTVVSGELCFQADSADGNPMEKRIGPGEHWGEWILDHGGMSTGQLNATEDTEVLVIKRQAFYDIRSTLEPVRAYLDSIDPQWYSQTRGQREHQPPG